MKKLSPFSTILVFVVLTIIGIGLLPYIQLQLNPSKTLPKITVSWSWSEASPKVMESEVTSLLEGGINAIKGIKHISSMSKKGSGNITITLKDGVDKDAIRFDIANTVRRVYQYLPKGVSMPQIRAGGDNLSSVFLLNYNIIAPVSPVQIDKYANESIIPKLSLIDGLNTVEVYGATPWVWEIIYDSELCQRLGISPYQVSSTISRYIGVDHLGVTELKGESNQISVVLETIGKSELDWSKIPIVNSGGRIIYLTDIATVTYKEQMPSQYFRVNGINTINLVVRSEKGENIIRLAEEVKKEIEVIKGELPKDWALRNTYDASIRMEKELNTLLFRTGLSILFLLLFVLFISKSGRYLLFVVSALTVNLSIAFIWYWFFDLEIHLYSLAGITISLGVIIDNSIVMIDHLKYKGNMKVFFAVLAATLTTIGALVVVFFLDESQKINLVDFAWVVIINLTVSIAVALLFIPSIMALNPLKERHGKRFFKRKRRVLKFERIYCKVLSFFHRWRIVFIILFIWGFGIPLYLLPDKVESEGRWADIYNSSFGSDYYNQELREGVKKWLGGTLRLFTEEVYDTSSYFETEQTKLTVTGTVPEGATIENLNYMIIEMENYIAGFDEIEMFITSINSAKSGSIEITFKEEFEDSSFPLELKSKLVSQAIVLGGMDWSVNGVGRGFSNAAGIGGKNSYICFEGYNYEQIYRIATKYREKISTKKRINNATVDGYRPFWGEPAKLEYRIKIDAERATLMGWSPIDILAGLKIHTFSQNVGSVYNSDQFQDISLRSDGYGKFDIWTMANGPLVVDTLQNRYRTFGKITKDATEIDIEKNNQQYRIYLTFNYVGPGDYKNAVIQRMKDEIDEELPLGFRVLGGNNKFGRWNKEDKAQYYLLFVVIAIIYLICAVLLESLRQPFAVIIMIPISFIGVFITFYLFNLNFDQGGYAAFIMLCGLSVNSALYILNDFNQYRRSRPNLPFIKHYIKAFHHKINPIILTISSTVLGLVPFLISGQNEVFWFAFAAGTIGGLIFSLIAIYIYLPILLWRK